MPSSSDATRVLAADLMDALEHAHVDYVEKPWGWEMVVRLDPGTLLKVIHVCGQERTSLQRHELKEEVIMVLDGEGGPKDQNGECLAHRGQATRIVPGQVHRSVGSCVLLEVSTNYPEDVIRIHDDYRRP